MNDLLNVDIHTFSENHSHCHESPRLKFECIYFGLFLVGIQINVSLEGGNFMICFDKLLAIQSKNPKKIIDIDFRVLVINSLSAVH